VRRRQPPAVAAERPRWLDQFVWQDWYEPDAPLTAEAAGFNGGTHADPAEVAWFRRVLAARHRWNAAREAWFFEHGQAADGYRVRLTGQTPHDRSEGEVN
jgi:hypothetical protein